MIFFYFISQTNRAANYEYCCQPRKYLIRRYYCRAEKSQETISGQRSATVCYLFASLISSAHHVCLDVFHIFLRRFHISVFVYTANRKRSLPSITIYGLRNMKYVALVAFSWSFYSRFLSDVQAKAIQQLSSASQSSRNMFEAKSLTLTYAYIENFRISGYAKPIVSHRS